MLYNYLGFGKRTKTVAQFSWFHRENQETRTILLVFEKILISFTIFLVFLGELRKLY